jgi:hypothetical protein
MWQCLIARRIQLSTFVCTVSVASASPGMVVLLAMSVFLRPTVDHENGVSGNSTKPAIAAEVSANTALQEEIPSLVAKQPPAKNTRCPNHPSPQ